MTDSFVAPSRSEIESIIAPHVRPRAPNPRPASPPPGILSRIKSVLRRPKRAQEKVRGEYEAEWQPSVAEHLAALRGRVYDAHWNGTDLALSPHGLRSLHLVYLERIIQSFGCRSVLEVGCGNGHMILTLATRFPDVRFSGCDLTRAGIAAADL